MSCRKVSIQGPGRGSALTAAGNSESRRYGVASPSAITVKTANDASDDNASAAPSAGARNGALHGVATMVARTPVKKEPEYPARVCQALPQPVAERPNSNTPLRL